ncbi:MAG: bacillithiol biosynthesis deacetylase BshB1 [Acidobacteria bacterium]|nr:bacillithiol biosynthesis deacetylase BshB1 [Acidobacteriota bacterium]
MTVDVLAFGAHPDDVELYAAGTLARLASEGYATGIVDLTRGELGSRGTVEVRAHEAREAARILGVKVRRNLKLPDGELLPTREARLKVIRVLRRYRPTLVLIHHWDDRHPDHANASRLVTEACHHAGLARIGTGQPRFRPNAILYYMLPAHSTPTFVVDVTGFSEVRRRAIEAYRSQLHDAASREPQTYLSRPEFLDHIENIHSFYGTLIGRAKGEAFYMRGIPEVSDLMGFALSQSQSRFR